MKDVLPFLLTDMFDQKMLEANYMDLLMKCEEAFNNLAVTGEQAQKATKGQSLSKLWFQHRAGRITASILKSAVHTDIILTSQSLIKKICYPESYKVSSQTTDWGLKMKKCLYSLLFMKMKHSNFSIKSSGLVINLGYPNIGASPDGIVRCDCCSLGVLEIKCPYICRDQSFADAIMNYKTLCLFSTDTLSTGHAYYYQVQAQIKLTKGSYGDFVLWSPHELLTLRMMISLYKHLTMHQNSLNVEFFLNLSESGIRKHQSTEKL